MAEIDERRLVVVLSDSGAPEVRAVQVVPPGGVDIEELGIEVSVGVWEGLPDGGVVRFGFPRPGFTPCTWLASVSHDALIERVGVVSDATVEEIEDALRLVEQPREWTPATALRSDDIRDALRHPRRTIQD